MKTTIAIMSIIFFASSYAKNETKLINENSTIQGTPNYSIRKFVISTGGGVISASNYQVHSVIGKIDAGHIANNSGYAISGGFLQQNTDLIFNNSFE